LLTRLSVCEFTSRLASPEPAPGGGSAAALSGLLGACLLEMVINLSLGCKGFAIHTGFLTEKKAELARLHVELQLLIDRDASAYAALVAAQNLPDTSKAERQARLAFIHEAVQQAAEVPLWTARSCLEVLEISRALLGKVETHAVSDLLIGALASHSGVVGGLANTAVNLPLLKDEHLVNAYSGQIHLLRTAADELLAMIQDRVYAEPPFRVMGEEAGC